MTAVSGDRLREIIESLVPATLRRLRSELIDELFEIAIIHPKDQEPLLKKIKRIIIGPIRSFRSPEVLKRDSHIAEYKSFLSYMIALSSKDKERFKLICDVGMGYTTSPDDPNGVLANASCLFMRRMSEREKREGGRRRYEKQNNEWLMTPEVMVFDSKRFIKRIRDAKRAKKREEIRREQEQERYALETKLRDEQIKEMNKMFANVPKCDRCGSMIDVTVVYRGYSTYPEATCHACRRKQTELAASCLSSDR